MKLSEAMRLGSMALPPIYGPVFEDGDDGKPCGACAIGSALYAVGRLEEPYNFTDHFADQWPWTADSVTHPTLRYSTTLTNAIAHLFERERWTREAIADWVQSIEDAQSEKDTGGNQAATEVSVATVGAQR